MAKKLELTIGSHEFTRGCDGCLSMGLIVEANTPRNIYLTITHFDNGGNKILTHYYCQLCVPNALNKVGQEALRPFNEGFYKDHFTNYLNPSERPIQSIVNCGRCGQNVSDGYHRKELENKKVVNLCKGCHGAVGHNFEKMY
jgi:hypothetical protein